MKIFGVLTELISVTFRKNSQAVTFRPNQATTYTASRDVQLPPGDAAHTLVSADSTQTLTNKTLTSPAITTPTGLVKGDVGLGNVDNTSDATKNAAVATLTNKTLTSPVINSPTGIVKGDVGLGNVDNTSDATKNSATATLTNKTIDGNSNTLTVLAGSQLSGATPIANGGTGQTGKTEAFDALAPTTTKGDIIVSNGTDNIRLAVGSNDQILVADSAQTAGVKWAANSSATQATATTLGVVQGGTVPGKASGVAVAAGYIGEKIAATLNSTYTIPTTLSDVTNASITLSAGVWMIVADLSIQIGGSGVGRVELTDSGNTLVGNGRKGLYTDISGVATLSANTTIVETVNISASTTYKLRATRGGLGVSTAIYGNDATQGYSAFYAVRIG